MEQVVKYSFLAVFLFFGLSMSAQKTESESSSTAIKIASDTASQSLMVMKRSPKKAALLSAVIPGAGQIYNKKYWKLPIVYLTVGGAAGSIIYNRIQYSRYKGYYVQDTNILDGDVSEFYQLYSGDYSQSTILTEEKSFAEQHLAWAEYSYLAFAAVYLLQIVDASVDAHLSSFDVGPDLTLNVTPTFNVTAQNRPIQGLTLKLTF